MSATGRRRSVKDFQFGSKIGEGSYSTVYKALDAYSGKVFAIKILSKAHIVKEKKIKYVNIEKQTLNRLGHHPGIVTLYYTFQDDASLFFVIDFAEYGELLTLIRKLGSLNEVTTRYYMVQLVDAIKFMHSKGVIHRDLKPENILLNHDMKLMITDFGAAKIVDEEGNIQEVKNKLPISGDAVEEKERSASFVGTAEYVSPELLQSNECGYESDIWAIGCILYQFIVGLPPFKGNTEYLTFEKIIALDYKFPSYYIPDTIKHLIKKILVLDPKQRFRIKDIQSHQFFKTVPWSDFTYIWKRNPPKIEAYDPRLYQQKLQSSIVPNMEVPSKGLHKQPINFYKKPTASASKTLDIINSTYVPSSSHIMPGNSPKKNLSVLHSTPPSSKSYPKIAPFNRGPVNSNSKVSPISQHPPKPTNGTTGIGIRSVSNSSNQDQVSQQQQQNTVTKNSTANNSPPAQRFVLTGQLSLQSQQQYKIQQHNHPHYPSAGSVNASPVHPQQRQASASIQNGSTFNKHEKQNSNNSVISQARLQHSQSQPNNFHYSKPFQPRAMQNSQSQPASPVSISSAKDAAENIQKPVLMDQSQILQKQIQLKKMQEGNSNDLASHSNELGLKKVPTKLSSAASQNHFTQTPNIPLKYSLPNLKSEFDLQESEPHMFSPLDQIGASFPQDDFHKQKTGDIKELQLPVDVNLNDKSKDVLIAANEAIQTAQKFRAKNLFTSSSVNASGENISESRYSPKSNAYNEHNDDAQQHASHVQHQAQHPYAMMRMKNSTSGSFSSDRKLPSPSFMKPDLNASESTNKHSFLSNPSASHEYCQRVLSDTKTIDTACQTSNNNQSTEAGKPFASPTESFFPLSPHDNKISAFDSLPLPKNTDELLSLKNNPLSNIRSRNNSLSPDRYQHQKQVSGGSILKESITNTDVSSGEKVSTTENSRGIQPQQLYPSPIVYQDEDIAPANNKSDNIPKEITELLLPDEKIIKLDTIVVSELSFESILKTSPDLLINSSQGSRLNLTDATINVLINKNSRVIEYYSKPEVMLITTHGKLIIIRSIDFDDKLFEIVLTDSKISLYDYEFDESECSGYLLLELIDKKSLLFLGPHDHKHVNINFEINMGITWIECLFKAKQLLNSRKKPSRSASANTISSIASSSNGTAGSANYTNSIATAGSTIPVNNGTSTSPIQPKRLSSGTNIKIANSNNIANIKTGSNSGIGNGKNVDLTQPQGRAGSKSALVTNTKPRATTSTVAAAAAAAAVINKRG